MSWDILQILLYLIGIAESSVVITTWGFPGFKEATNQAAQSLLAGKGRMQALVDGLSYCEDAGCEGTVGAGGSPNEQGETVLDALLIDSPTMSMGAVANMHSIAQAAKVAWAVMNYTKHTLLVGEAATAFAKEMGFVERNLSSQTSTEEWRKWKQNNCQPNFRQNVIPSSETSCGPYKPSLSPSLSNRRFLSNDIRHNHDTIGMVIVDDEGHISAGTSTNGATFKMAGRVGDSPMPGSGAFLLPGVGGAAATGDGDILMRFVPSSLAVHYMQQGTKPMRACRKAISLVSRHFPSAQGGIVCVNTKFQTGASCIGMRNFTYSFAINGAVKLNTVRCVKQQTIL